MTQMDGCSPQRLHQIDCKALTAPERVGGPGSPDAHEALMRYISLVEPAYQSLSALIGQTALVLLLSPGQPHDWLQTDNVTRNLAWAVLRDATAQLRDLSVPEAATHHHWILQQVTQSINEILTQLGDGPVQHNSEPTTSHQNLTRNLRNAHDMLQSVAIPSVGLTTFDFTQACCSCNFHKPVLADHALI